jgi:hypothetical protein
MVSYLFRAKKSHCNNAVDANNMTATTTTDTKANGSLKDKVRNPAIGDLCPFLTFMRFNFDSDSMFERKLRLGNGSLLARLRRTTPSVRPGSTVVRTSPFVRARATNLIGHCSQRWFFYFSNGWQARPASSHYLLEPLLPLLDSLEKCRYVALPS